MCIIISHHKLHQISLNSLLVLLENLRLRHLQPQPISLEARTTGPCSFAVRCVSDFPWVGCWVKIP